MKVRGWRSCTVAIGMALALGACDRGEPVAGRMPLDVQLAHPGGVVLQLDTFSVGDEITLVQARVLNGRDRDIELNAGRGNTYLITDTGEKLLLVAPDGNPALVIPAGQSADAALVFAGTLPLDERATLVINQHSQSDRVYPNSPRFESPLPETSGRVRRNLPETSVLSGMRANAVSRLTPAPAGVSGLRTGGLRMD